MTRFIASDSKVSVHHCFFNHFRASESLGPVRRGMISLLQSSLCSRSHLVSEDERMLKSTRLLAMGTWRR